MLRSDPANRPRRRRASSSGDPERSSPRASRSRSSRKDRRRSAAKSTEPKADERDGGFVLYVEGPRDRDILRTWARRFDHSMAREIERCAVILGGRQLARAEAHFQELSAGAQGTTGLVVLDRDDAPDQHLARPPVPGLEVFTWGLRHIESYLLVPSAIRRLIRVAADDPRSERAFRECLPDPGDDEALRQLDAKRLLGVRGGLAQLLGAALPPGDIARCMRRDELHEDILELFDRIRGARRGPPGGPEVVVRGGGR